MKHQALLTVLTYQAKLKLAIIIIIFFYFSVWRNPRKRVAMQEEGNFEVLKRCYVQVYPASVLLCYGKAVNLQRI